jgi:nitrate reductase gamma subunit
MKLKLKEKPNEWRKFTLVWCVAIPFFTWLLVRKGWASAVALKAVGVAAAAVAVLALIAPRFFRGFYRVGMTASFHVGQVMGKDILTVIFLLVVTPMGLLLRAMGKDLLDLKRDSAKESCWRPARKIGAFEQQF